VSLNFGIALSRTTVRIDFSVPANGGEVEIVVYNVEGRRVIDLTSGPVPPGFRNVTWDGRDASGRSVSPGVYFVRMTASGFSATRKAVMLR
jgi:flagellar hook assembly protein FlgD